MAAWLYAGVILCDRTRRTK